MAARAHVLNLEDQNLCMFKTPLTEWELQRTKICLLVVMVTFLLFRYQMIWQWCLHYTYINLLFKCFVNVRTQTPPFNWSSLPTFFVSPTWLPTTPSPSPALPLSLREWSHQRHSLGEGELAHNWVPWFASLLASPPPTWTSPPAPVYWQWGRSVLQTTATAAELTSEKSLLGKQ